MIANVVAIPKIMIVSVITAFLEFLELIAASCFGNKKRSRLAPLLELFAYFVMLRIVIISSQRLTLWSTRECQNS